MAAAKPLYLANDTGVWGQAKLSRGFEVDLRVSGSHCAETVASPDRSLSPRELHSIHKLHLGCSATPRQPAAKHVACKPDAGGPQPPQPQAHRRRTPLGPPQISCLHPPGHCRYTWHFYESCWFLKSSPPHRQRGHRSSTEASAPTPACHASIRQPLLWSNIRLLQASSLRLESFK